MARYAKTARMFRILEMLRRSRYGLRLEQIAHEVECSTRTVRRYLDAMQSEALYPVYSEQTDQGRVWKLLDSHRESTLVPVSIDEVRGIVMARKLLGSKGERAGITDALDSVTRKLRSQLDPAFDSVIDEMDRMIVSTPLTSDIPVGEVVHFGEVSRAIRNKVKLQFDYRDRHGVVTRQRKVAPLAYCMSEGKTYLVAHCFLRDAIRQFVPGHMSNVRVTRSKITTEIDFDAAAYAQSSFGIFRFEPTEILLRIAPSLAEHFRDAPAHPTQELFQDGGEHFLRFVVGPDWLVVRWVCQFGASMEVVRPERLREWVASALAEALANYQE